MNLNLNLGIPQLIPAWKKLFSRENFFADLGAGMTVAFVAIPLSLAIALASGVSPGTGLITAVVAGIVCAIFGGAPLAVSGPAAAMSVLIADTVEKFGVKGLIFVCLIAGVMQLISGICGLGKLSRYVPLPVIAGFTAGIGVIILIGQLPRAFGLAPPPESHIFDVFSHIKEYFHEINGTSLVLVIITIAIIRGLPKFLPRIPAILPAVIATTLIVYLFNLNDVPLIGTIPDHLPAPRFPEWANIPISELLLTSFTVYLLASLETLLSASAVDKLSREKKHDSDQELIGQGLGNIAVSLFGGIPVTGVIARSVTNVRAGAKTQRASIIHSLIILFAVYLASPLIAIIPIAALAGVLFSIAFSMINYKEFHAFWLTTRSEAFIYVVTFFTIIFVDLIAGVQAGIIAAATIMLLKAARTHLLISSTTYDNTMRLSLVGALTFLSTNKIVLLEKKLASVKAGQIILLDLSDITNLDSSGATSIIDLYTHCQEHGIKFYIKGLPRRFESIFKMCGGEALLEENYLISEHELRNKESSDQPRSSRGRLIHGVHRFYATRKHNDKRLFEYIAQQQDPHTLFITCSDSRIIPSMITSADPGELFIIRNVGNAVPTYNEAAISSEAAALEFALTNLDITDIVICGHANCGAIKACQANEPSLLPQLDAWISIIRSQLQIDDGQPLNEVAQMNVLNQIANLKTYPLVQERLANKTIALHAWFFDFDQSLIFEWNEEKQAFKSFVNAPPLAVG